MAAGVAATVFAVVPHRTASESYIAVIRAGSRLSYAARQTAVAIETCSFPMVRLVCAPDAQPDKTSASSNATMVYMLTPPRPVGSCCVGDRRAACATPAREFAGARNGPIRSEERRVGKECRS